MLDILRTITVSGGLILNSLRGRVANIPKESDLPAHMIQASSTAHTEADDLVQEVALEILRGKFPECSINAEEDTPRVSLFGRDRSELCFHIDPLDGTLAYTQGRDDFAIGAGFSKELEFVCSAIYFPARDKLYMAQRGGGVVVTDGMGNQLSFNRPSSASPRYVQKRCEDMVEKVESMGLQPYPSLGAHNTMIAVAEGKVSMQMYKMASPHDFGIPQVIVEEAGGVCSDQDGNPIVYGEDFGRVSYFFAFFDEELRKQFFSS